MATPGGSPRLSRHELLPILAIVIVGAAFRVSSLDDSAYYDEIWTLENMDAASIGDFWRLKRETDPPASVVPVYFTVQYALLELTDVKVITARIFSVVCGLASLVIVYLVGQRLFGRSAAITAGLLLAVSLSHVYYSTEIRMYPLVLFLAAFSMLCHVSACESGRSRWLQTLFLTNVLLVWTHLFAVFLIGAQWIHLALYRRQTPHFRRWTILHAILGLVATAWVALMWSPGVGDTALWFETPSLRDLANAFLVFAGGRATNWNPAPRLPGGVSLDFAIGAVMLGLVVFAASQARRIDRSSESGIGAVEAVTMLLLFLVLPPLAPWIASQVIRPMFVYRYELYVVLPFAVLAGAGIAWIPERRVRVALVVLVFGCYAYQLLALRTPLRPDYAAAAVNIRARGGPSDAILALKAHNARSLVFNSDIEPEDVVTVAAGDELAGAVTEAVYSGDTAWVIVWRHEALDTFEAELRNAGTRAERTAYGGMPFLYLYRVSN